jgi:hypothetical protein
MWTEIFNFFRSAEVIIEIVIVVALALFGVWALFKNRKKDK